MSALARKASKSAMPPRRMLGASMPKTREGVAGEGEDLVERGVGIGLAEELEAGLFVLLGTGVALAIDGAEIAEGGGGAEGFRRRCSRWRSAG